MIHCVTITKSNGEQYTQYRNVLADPYKLGFAITNIEGLGPGQAELSSREYTVLHGGIVSNVHKPIRDITFHITFLWCNTIEETRQRSYQLFPLGEPITITIESDNGDFDIVGFVASNEPNIFSKDENTVVVVRCPDYFFTKHDSTTTVVSGAEPAFEFVYSNESLSDKLTVFGHIQSEPIAHLMNQGSSGSGFTTTIYFWYPYSQIIVLDNDTTKQRMSIDLSRISGGVQFGDEIIINTQPGQKEISLLHGGVKSNIIETFVSGSWPLLVSGENLIGVHMVGKVRIDDPNRPNFITCYFSHDMRFDGV